MNKRIVLILLVLATLLLFGSCDENGDDTGKEGGNEVRGILVSEDKKADARMEQILAIIKNNDREALKLLFSNQALDEAIDIDGGMDYLFNLMQGDIDTWEREKWTSHEEIDHGKKSLMIVSWYIVNTSQEKYLFILIDYDMDTINPQNAGLYTLFAIKEAERETHYTYWQDIMIAGIYNPKE